MSDFFLEDVKHHIAKNPICRNLYIWDLLWLLFGIRKKEHEHKLCKAQSAMMPRAWKWLMEDDKVYNKCMSK